MERALRQWERKCLNRVARGQSACCDFQSDLLNEDLMTFIFHGLKDAVRKEDVRSLFGRVTRLEWDESKHPRDEDGKFGYGLSLGKVAEPRWKNRLVAELGERAANGLAEAVYAHDLDTGKLLGYGEADENVPDAVELDEDKIKNTTQVGVYHSHPHESPFSAEDWYALLSNNNVKESVVVNPDSIYTARKPADGKIADKYKVANPYMVALAHKRRIMIQRGFGRTPDDKMKDKDLLSVWEEVGNRMAQDYGVSLVKEDLK